jgi:hypothetical protein
LIRAIRLATRTRGVRRWGGFVQVLFWEVIPAELAYDFDTLNWPTLML